MSFFMLKDLIQKNRSYRRFIEDEPILRDTLTELINLARFSPSAGNLQPLKYILSCKKEKNELIFKHIKWAAYLTDWVGPEKGERPSAYIIITGDRNVSSNFYCDHGIAAQSILLGAIEKGLGGCIIANIDKQNLIKDLNIPQNLEILLVIALGTPEEKIKIEGIPENKSIKYWRTADRTHHVPKRSLEDIILLDY